MPSRGGQLVISVFRSWHCVKNHIVVLDNVTWVFLVTTINLSQLFGGVRLPVRHSRRPELQIQVNKEAPLVPSDNTRNSGRANRRVIY